MGGERSGKEWGRGRRYLGAKGYGGSKKAAGVRGLSYRAGWKAPQGGLGGRGAVGTCFVGLAGDQFCRNLGEKAFSYCG